MVDNFEINSALNSRAFCKTENAFKANKIVKKIKYCRNFNVKIAIGDKIRCPYEWTKLCLLFISLLCESLLEKKNDLGKSAIKWVISVAFMIFCAVFLA